MDSTIIAAIISGITAIVVAIIGGIFALRKTKSNTTDKPSQKTQVGENVITAKGQSTQTVNFYNKDLQEKKPSETALIQSRDLETEIDIINDNIPPFRVFLGKQHKLLRENYLNLTVREMADFYGFEKASILEACEAGENELPRICVDSLATFFFVNKDFLEKGGVIVFQTVYVFGKQLQDLLDDNFKPFFLVKTKPRNGLYAYPILHKIDNGFSRVVALNLSSFHSDGGGRHNVENIIRKMIKKGIDSNQTSVIQVSQEVWNKLENDTFYSKDPSSLGYIDYECQDIFSEWYSELLKNH